MIRKQIVVPPDVDARVRRLAQQRGVSQSAVIVDAIRTMSEPEQDLDRLLSFTGTIDGPAEALSEQVDAVLYGA